MRLMDIISQNQSGATLTYFDPLFLAWETFFCEVLGRLSLKAYWGHSLNTAHGCETCLNNFCGTLFGDLRSRSKVMPGSGAKTPVNALDFLKIALGQPFLQEGLSICGSQMSSKTGDLDLFFKVTGSKRFWPYANFAHFSKNEIFSGPNVSMWCPLLLLLSKISHAWLWPTLTYFLGVRIVFWKNNGKPVPESPLGSWVQHSTWV